MCIRDSHAAIGVGDDLAAGKAAVARGPANDKSSRRVDEILCVLVEQFRRQHRENDLFQDRIAQRVDADLRAVLRGDDDGGNAFGLSLIHI